MAAASITGNIIMTRKKTRRRANLFIVWLSIFPKLLGLPVHLNFTLIGLATKRMIPKAAKKGKSRKLAVNRFGLKSANLFS